jgi:hypothetical protein
MALQTLSTEIQKLISVSTPATIHVLSQSAVAHNNYYYNNNHHNDNYAVDESASNVITVLDPHEIERAGISQAFHLPPPQMMTMMNGNPAAAFDSMNQSLYYQQSLLSHDVQSELMNLTESINKITERPEAVASPQKKYKSVLSGKPRGGEEEKGRNDRSFDVKVARTHSRSPSPTRSSHRQPTNSSSSKERNNSSSQNNRPSSPTRSPSPSRRPYLSSSSFLQTNDVRKIEEMIMELNTNYHKEIASMHSSILNIANHYSKLENHFNVVYEKKILYKFSELENRIMKLEEMMFYKDNQYHGPSGVLPPHRGMRGAGDEEEKNNHFQATMNDRVVQQLSKSVYHQNEQIAQQQHHLDNLAMRSTAGSAAPPGTTVGDSDPVMMDELTNRLEIIEKMIELQKEKEIQQKLQLLSTQTTARVTQNKNHHHNQSSGSPKDSKKEKLLQQLSYLDHQIAQEKFDSDLNNINQENILRLSTSRSVDTSPLSASAMNTPHHFPAHHQSHLQTIQDPSFLNDNHPGEDGRVSSFSPAPNNNSNDNNANIPHSSSGDLYFQNSLSNLNRFQRIAALHNTLNQHQINNPPPAPPLSQIGGPSSEYETINNEELTSPTDLRSNASSSKNTRRTSASGKQQHQTPISTGKNVIHRQDNNRNKESGAPEYYYETLLPPTFQSQQQQPQQQQQPVGGQKRKDEKRDFSPNKHFQRIHNPTEQQEDRPRQQQPQNRSSPARETHSLQHGMKDQMRNSGKSFMGSTRAAELKRNPSNQRLPHDKTFL